MKDVEFDTDAVLEACRVMLQDMVDNEFRKIQPLLDKARDRGETTLVLDRVLDEVTCDSLALNGISTKIERRKTILSW